MNVNKVLGGMGVLAFIAVFLLAGMSGVSAELPRDDLALHLYSVDLNGEEGYTKVATGKTMTVTFFYLLNTHITTQEEDVNMVVGFTNQFKYWLVGKEDWETVSFNGYYHFNRTFRVSAPREPGLYNIYAVRTDGLSNSDAIKVYEELKQNNVVATIEVVDAEDGAWDSLYKKEMQLKIKKHGTIVDYKIELLQRENFLRAEISTPDRYAIRSGGLSLSTEENIYVDYHHARVLGSFPRLPHEAEYSEIEPNSGVAFAEKTALMLAGLIPGIGSSLNVIGYLEDATKKDDQAEKYYSVDLTKDPEYDPEKYFSYWDMANYRDVTVIPWHISLIGLPGTAIRVECPELYPEDPGKTRIVFRADFFIYESRVQHDVEIWVNLS